jgi:hypothetical protein
MEKFVKEYFKEILEGNFSPNQEKIRIFQFLKVEALKMNSLQEIVVT